MKIIAEQYNHQYAQGQSQPTRIINMDDAIEAVCPKTRNRKW